MPGIQDAPEMSAARKIIGCGVENRSGREKRKMIKEIRDDQ
jgi:hypothetical protein